MTNETSCRATAYPVLTPTTAKRVLHKHNIDSRRRINGCRFAHAQGPANAQFQTSFLQQGKQGPAAGIGVFPRTPLPVATMSFS